MNNEKIHTISAWLGSGSINIFGMPFAGKNTQAERFVDMLGATMIASGDIFRAQKDNVELQQIMASGANIPSSMFFDIMLPYFNQPELVGKPLVLSEVGRKNGEQETVLKATIEANHPTKAVVLLNLTVDEVWKRYDAAQLRDDRGDRQDDGNPDIVTTRLEKFEHDIVPVIEFYRQQGLLIEVNGAVTQDEVTSEIIDALYERATAN